MLISEAIQKIKNYTSGVDMFTQKPISDETTRDRVIYGNTNQECSGIVTTCFASCDVIEKAHELGYNFIICHEAVFWNHGDHTDWLEDNKNSVYLKKKELLDKYNICIWRCHDYIHSGVSNGNGGYYDGIFKGFLYYTGLEKYYIKKPFEKVQFKTPILLDLDGLKVKDVADMMINNLNLNGVRIVGNPDTVIHNAMVSSHIMSQDNHIINLIEEKNIDLLIAMEIVDYTVNLYIRDAINLGYSKAIITAGHFNTEEIGMKYMLEWIPQALSINDIKATYIQSGDANRYITK